MTGRERTPRVTWIERLQRAVKRGKFAQQDRRRAEDWTKCAVGEAHDKAPRIVVRMPGYVTPADETLATLGSQFAYDVSRDHVGAAVSTYLAIQAQVRELRAAKAVAS